MKYEEMGGILIGSKREEQEIQLGAEVPEGSCVLSRHALLFFLLKGLEGWEGPGPLCDGSIARGKSVVGDVDAEVIRSQMMKAPTGDYCNDLSKSEWGSELMD